jgi:ABC-type polysaccharide/polyol phosphate transport system ATPase subunit|tara:strand:- start:5252 stop:6001 length:750 start_codon:yes stop_codon:yes gene_type:complete
MSSIELNNVCLDYILKTGTDSFKQTVLSMLKRSKNANKSSINNSTFQALSNINLKISKGDRVGLLGRNGAGKSTLLRVMAKIYTPTEGFMHVNGAISNLFDVNLGINVEATGYENIINLGIMRGWSKQDAYSIVGDIELFTELGDFLNKPVCTYSTGMQMKLAFSVATARPPEIVLIDEIIGAGDAHFMKKATRRIENMVDRSHILVLTSHSNEIIRNFCNKVCVLQNGKLIYSGDVESGIQFYEDTLN